MPEIKDRFLIDKEDQYFIKERINDLVREENIIKAMTEGKIVRTTYELPSLFGQSRWLRILIGDVDCHHKTGVTITYKQKNEDGEETHNPILRVEEFDHAKAFFEAMGFIESSTQETKRTKYYVTFDKVKYIIRFDIWPGLEDYCFVTVEEASAVNPEQKESFIRQLGIAQYDKWEGHVDIDKVYLKYRGFRAMDIPELTFHADLDRQKEKRKQRKDAGSEKLYLWLDNEADDAAHLYEIFKQSNKKLDDVIAFLQA